MGSSEINIFIAADSTAATNYEDTFPQTGWGQMLGIFINGSVVIKNHAINGRSTKSFIDQGRLKDILDEIKTGDFLFIQFGHNDEKKEDPERYTNPNTSYKENLRTFINGAKERGATPVLISPVTRRTFNESGKIINSHSDYYEAVTELSKELGVAYIDLFMKSKILLEELGDEKSKELFMWLKPGEYEKFTEGISDNTHFNRKGAYEVAKLVVEGIKEEKIVPLCDMII
jgi:lysophospholipase L1-like esterase